ncbi:MAG TPA: hypothetical protein PLX71_00165 [Phycicoccus sp.]|nr:hypothetical protein [Phycicoccus sp.]
MANFGMLTAYGPTECVYSVLKSIPGASEHPRMLAIGEATLWAEWNDVGECTDIGVYDPERTGLAAAVYDALTAQTDYDLEWYDEDTADLLAERKSPVVVA